MPEEPLPRLTEAVSPPFVLGTACLAHAAFAGADSAVLEAMIAAETTDSAARAYDRSIASQLAFRRAEALDHQDEALAASPLYRVRGAGDGLRLLALVAPGDLMMNTPLDFLTNHLDVRLDLLHLLPNTPLPDEIPDHDIAFVAASEPDEETLQRLTSLFTRWPRPILNDPRLLRRLDRDTLSASLRGIEGLCSATTRPMHRDTLEAHLDRDTPVRALLDGGDGPVLIRPHGTHAGAGLRKVATKAELRFCLTATSAREFYVTEFVDYRSEDGLFRKYRVGFIDRTPYLCHMAVSSHWMIHYLNAGMTESAAKRADEARAMADFDDGFARRHEAAFAALHDVLGFDFYSIDCAETPDGRLLVFEADTAAIIHAMDPPDLFPYKAPQMRRVFEAFGAMLERKADQASAFAM